MKLSKFKHIATTGFLTGSITLFSVAAFAHEGHGNTVTHAVLHQLDGAFSFWALTALAIGLFAAVIGVVYWLRSKGPQK